MEDNTGKKRLLSIGEASEYLGVSIDTLRRWEKKDRIIALRSPGGHRYYAKDDLDALFGKRYKRDEVTIRRTDEELGKTQSPELLLKEKPPTPYAPENPVKVASEEVQNIKTIDQAPTTYAEEIKTPTEAIENIPAEEPDTLSQVKVASPDATIKEDIKSNETPSPLKAPIPYTVDESAEKGFFNESPVTSVKEESNLLTEEEIERRIGVIIKTGNQKKSKTGDIMLIFFFSIFFLIDAFLLYLWVTTSRIISPIP